MGCAKTPARSNAREKAANRRFSIDAGTRVERVPLANGGCAPSTRSMRGFHPGWDVSRLYEPPARDPLQGTYIISARTPGSNRSAVAPGG